MGVLQKFGLAVFLSTLALAAGASQDKDFVAARDAYAKGRIDQFERLADKFPKDHLLAPYLRYWRLKSNNPSAEAMQAFIGQHADTPLSDRMRQDLVRKLAEAGDWPGVMHQAGRLVKTDAETQCFTLRARLALNEATAQKDGVAFYRNARDLPSACDPLFAQLFERGALSDEDRYDRIRHALEANNLRLARELDGRLPADQRMQADALARAQKSPAGLVKGGSEQRAQREAALYALAHIAKQDTVEAAHLWEAEQGNYTENERGYGWGTIAMAAAKRHEPRALEWYARAGEPISEAQRTWKVRAALWKGNWLEALYGINGLPEATQAEPTWRYWKARALQALKSTASANAMFARLSNEFHYYGLLAAEELGTRLETRGGDHVLTPDELAETEERTGLRRALLLRKLDLKIDAVAEWDWTLRALSDAQILAAAELARREKWYDRAILTAEKTRDIHNFDLRYMTPYRDIAEAYARRNELDPAWVYGLMRQESRFMDYARSSVGAIGLMQIMPATARWIAGQLGLSKAKAAEHMKEPEENIRYGTYYLKRIHGSLGQSAVLATAGYNAGPGRARKWQADKPLEAAIYIDNIPILETRDYVRKVMANAIFYSQRFGSDHNSLKARIGVIPARTKGVNGDEASPDPD
ncbi:MAG: lytic transglycosylase domain-containing protein [Betaproteobacteria bacterium]|nr:lytic transglycosylase domain-containing protein [Betaproteobacteria bacterium]